MVDNFDPFYDRSLKESNLAEARKSPGFHLVEQDIRDAPAAAARRRTSFART